jgi:hypothetical protein
VTGPEQWDGQGGELRAMTDADWRSVADFAYGTDLVGLAARNLGWAEEATGFRAPILGTLSELRRVHLLQHLAARAAARRIADAFVTRSIPFIAFKGFVLAEEVYGDLSLRDFGDFDAMVESERVEEAWSVAKALGYRLMQLDDIREHVRLGAHAAGMIHADGSNFDLHWNLSPDVDPALIPLVWRGCLPAPPGSSLPGLRLSPEMTLVHLAAHFHAAQYGSFKSLADFHVAWMRYADLHRDRLEGAARELRLSAVLDIVAALRARTFAALSEPERARDPVSGRARIALRVLTDDFLLEYPRRSRLENWLRFLMASGGLSWTVRSLREILLPGRLQLARFFNRPYGADMYPRYYGRQLMKVVTLSRR